MRYFLVILFGVTSFLSSAQVVISPKTARYFLEVDDSLQIYKQTEAQRLLQVNDLKQQIVDYDSTLSSYKRDSIACVEKDKLAAERLAFEKAQTKIAEKSARRARTKATLVVIGSVVIVILVII